MKFRGKEVQRWERWGRKSPVCLFLGAFLIYMFLGLVLELFDFFVGIEFGFVMGVVMALYFGLTDCYRMEAYRDSLARAKKDGVDA